MSYTINNELFTCNGIQRTQIYLEEKESWIELGGAGMFRPEVLKPLGIDQPALAFGMGIFNPLDTKL